MKIFPLNKTGSSILGLPEHRLSISNEDTLPLRRGNQGPLAKEDKNMTPDRRVMIGSNQQ